MKIIGSDILKLFEFDKIREKTGHYCRCNTSREKAENLSPYSDREALIITLKQTNEFMLSVTGQGYFPDTFFDDFENESVLLNKSGSTLNENQFGLVRSAVLSVNNLLKFLNERQALFPNLILLTKGLSITPEIPAMIDEIIDSHAQVKSNASELLQEIRSQQVSKRKEADRRFRSYIIEMKKKGFLRENEENFYNNRRVLAVPSEYKREIRGLVHGKSDSGKTTFIEPELLVGLNNEISELDQDEKIEIRRLLRELTEKLRAFASMISASHRFLSELDFIRAKAMFSSDINGVLPTINKFSVVNLVNARHPLLYLQNKTHHKKVVPLNIHLDQNNRILVISGPNAGGKSIALKTIGLLQLMLQSGLLVSADEKSQLCFFNFFLADIGDSQSIEYALSTYSSRLLSMKSFLETANNRTLILIDEFGTGTNPELGGAIAEVVLEELNRKKAFGIFTTHYTNIKLLADKLEGVSNGSMLFDPETFEPRYVLLAGQPGSSYTFEVAEKIGLPIHLLERAKKKIQKEKLRLNSMLAELHKQKSKIETELLELKNKQALSEVAEGKYTLLSEKLSEKMESEKEKREELRKLAEAGRKYISLAEEWEKSKDRKAVIKKFVGAMTAEKKKKAAENTPQKLEKKKQALIERLKNEIHVGSRVRMLKSKQVGLVEEIHKNVIYVNFGNIRAKVAIENLELA